MGSAASYTMIVRDQDQLLRAEGVASWDAITLLAALSADPRSSDELRRAYLRYRPDESLSDWPWQGEVGGCPGGGWMVVDLAGRRVVVGGGAELPASPAVYEPDEPVEHEGREPLVWIHLPPEWQASGDAEWYQALPPLSTPHEPLDARGVLFGRALAEGIAARTLAESRAGKLPTQLPPSEALDGPPPDETQLRLIKQWHALTVRVHADWLMTPHNDLEGQPPRVFLHRNRDWVDQELHYRQQQWSRERRAPRPIDRDTFAYRFGPLGRHEVVMYFGLCRAVIAQAWQCLMETPLIDAVALAELLHQRASRWLAEPRADEDDPMPPGKIIEHERRRLPLVGDGKPLDCDCPLCRMEAEGAFGPSFYGYDGHHLELDNEFAFSLCADRQQWQHEQDEYRRMNEQFEAEWRRREQIATANGDQLDTDEVPLSGIWQRAMVDWDAMRAPGVPNEVMVMGIGMLVGELVDDLKSAGVERLVVNRLNAAFDDYRRAASDPALAEAAECELADVLENIAANHRQLTAKAADLQSRLAELRLVARG